MGKSLVAADPEAWQSVLRALLIPVAWIPKMQQSLLEFLFYSSSGWTAAAKFVFLMFPLMLFVAAMWCTMLSVYTVLFRSNRTGFIATILIAWWDAARAVCQYWVGFVRLALVAMGWILTLARLGLKLVMEVLKQILIAPFTMTGRLSKSYFQPGVPWIAFLLLIGWCMLEATIFTYVMFPTVGEVLADLVGVQAPTYTGPVLYLFLLLLMLGSFACLQALLDTINKRQFKFIIQMIVIELFVMSFEVMFLYRELVDAITPWVAQQTGERMGVASVLMLAAFGWVGIRGMTWFLFGQFGTPPLLAFISRQPLEQAQGPAHVVNLDEAPNWWHVPVRDFKVEIEWLHGKSDEVLGYLTLPVLQVLAAALNFAMIVLASRTIFNLPLNSLKEVMETRAILAHLKLQPRKVES